MFLEKFALKYHRPLTGIAPDAQEVLESLSWNGNIRELQNCIEKAVILSEGKSLTAGDIQTDSSAKGLRMTDTYHSEQSEESAVREAMARAGGNISAAAKMLGVSRPTLYAKLKKFGL